MFNRSFVTPVLCRIYETIGSRRIQSGAYLFYDIIFDKRIKTAVLIHLVKIEIAQAYYRAVVAFNLFTVATHIFSVIGAFAADVITAASQKNLAAVFRFDITYRIFSVKSSE